jgi:hypothetical protein
MTPLCDFDQAAATARWVKPMNDNEARGLILRKIYDLRNTGRFINSGELNNLGFDRVALDRHLTQLEQLDLITMKALRDDSGLVDAMIQITPYGSNSIERPETAPPQILIIGDVHVGMTAPAVPPTAKFSDAVILKPAFMGMGIDLQKAWNWVQDKLRGVRHR